MDANAVGEDNQYKEQTLTPYKQHHNKSAWCPSVQIWCIVFSVYVVYTAACTNIAFRLVYVQMSLLNPTQWPGLTSQQTFERHDDPVFPDKVSPWLMEIRLNLLCLSCCVDFDSDKCCPWLVASFIGQDEQIVFQPSGFHIKHLNTYK